MKVECLYSKGMKIIYGGNVLEVVSFPLNGIGTFSSGLREYALFWTDPSFIVRGTNE